MAQIQEFISTGIRNFLLGLLLVYLSLFLFSLNCIVFHNLQRLEYFNQATFALFGYLSVCELIIASVKTMNPEDNTEKTPLIMFNIIQFEINIKSALKLS